MTVDVFLGLGANLGDAAAAVRRAIDAVGRWPRTRLVAASSLYDSAPVGCEGPDFCNAVVQIRTALAPSEVLRAAQELENRAGRTRPYRNAPRTLDVDVLLYGNETIDTPTLQVPHPRIRQRAFVLLPLAEIAPQLVEKENLAAVAGQRVRLRK